MIRIHPLLGALLIAGLCTSARADEIRLADGRVLVGTVRTVGDQVRIQTRDGDTVVVSADEVVRVRSDDELRDELRRLADAHGAAPHARLELALLAWRYGLTDEMWKHVDACLDADADGAIRDRLDRLLAGVESELIPPHRARADAPLKVRSLLDKVHRTTSPGRVAAVEAVLATLQGDGVDEQLRLRARTASNALQRETALRALNRRGDAHETFVWRAAILDRDAEVRAASMQIARRADRTRAAIDYLTPGLAQPDGRIRMRTAEAFAELGDVAAVVPLVAAGPSAGSAELPATAPRAHVAFLNQQAYVRDFEVEVAMASFIADPKISALQSGVVLDVSVVAVTRMRAQVVDTYRRALVALAKDDPGPDPSTWDGWLDGRAEIAEVREDLAAAAAKKLGRMGKLGAGVPAGPGAAGGGAGRGGAGKAGGADPESGGIGIPILPGTLPPLPGTTFPPGPPPPRPPTPGIGLRRGG